MDRVSARSSRPDTRMSGKQILIVEDEFFVAEELVCDFTGMGANIIGPVPSLAAALEAVARTSHLDGAVLDINLVGDMVYPLVDELREHGVRCVFSTGYDRHAVPPAYRGIPLCQKPVDPAKIAKALFG